MRRGHLTPGAAAWHVRDMKFTKVLLLLGVWAGFDASFAAEIKMDKSDVVIDGLNALRGHLERGPGAPRRGLATLLGFAAWQRVQRLEYVETSDADFLYDAQRQVERGLTLDDLLARALPGEGASTARPTSLWPLLRGLGLPSDEADKLVEALRFVEFADCAELFTSGPSAPPTT